MVVELRVVTLVLIAIHLLNSAKLGFLETSILGRSETKLCSLASLYEDSLERWSYERHILRSCAESKGALGLSKDIVVVRSISINEWTIRLLNSLREAVVEHCNGSILNIFIYDICWRLLQRVWIYVVLEDNLDVARLELLVLVDNNDRLCIVRNLYVDDRSGILRVGDRTKELLNHSLGMVYINIANYDDTLVCWMIPFLIVVAKLLILEVVDDRHQADRITLTILTVRIKLLEIALKHT